MQECLYTHKHKTHRRKFEFRWRALCFGCLGHAGMSLHSETWNPPPKNEFRQRISRFGCLGHVVMFLHSDTPPKIEFRQRVSSLRVPRTCKNVFTLETQNPLRKLNFSVAFHDYECSKDIPANPRHPQTRNPPQKFNLTPSWSNVHCFSCLVHHLAISNTYIPIICPLC